MIFPITNHVIGEEIDVGTNIFQIETTPVLVTISILNTTGDNSTESHKLIDDTVMMGINSMLQNIMGTHYTVNTGLKVIAIAINN
jgi:hypothetical protein